MQTYPVAEVSGDGTIHAEARLVADAAPTSLLATVRALCGELELSTDISNVAAALKEVCSAVGVDPAGMTLKQQAQRCTEVIGMDLSHSQPPSSGAAAQDAVVVATVVPGNERGARSPLMIGSSEWRAAWQEAHRAEWDAFRQLELRDSKAVQDKHQDQLALMEAVGGLDLLAEVATKDWWAPYWRGQDGMPQGSSWEKDVKGAEQLPAVIRLVMPSGLDDIQVQVIEVRTDWHAKRFVLAEVYGGDDEALIYRERFDAHLGKVSPADPHAFSYFLKLREPVSNPKSLIVVLDGVLCGANFNVVLPGLRVFGVASKGTKAGVSVASFDGSAEKKKRSWWPWGSKGGHDKRSAEEFPEPYESTPNSGRVRVSGHVGSGGKYFSCLHEGLEAAAGAPLGSGWTGKGGSALPSQVKGGEGGVLRARNRRSGKEGGALVWRGADKGTVVGCWNPAEFASGGDWADGDELEVLDCCFSQEQQQGPSAVALASSRVEGGSGWNLGAERMSFGECGVVGDHWNTLTASFEFKGAWSLEAVRTDSVTLPFSLDVQRRGGGGGKGGGGGGNWEEVATNLRGPLAGVGPLRGVTGARLTWASTDLHQTGGLSTARSGGGLHADFWGTAE